MRKLVVFFSFFLVSNFVLVSVVCAQSYWQQHVDYVINVSLNDIKHEINGDITIEYKNNSPEPLNFIYFHLWANAYKNNSTAFAKQEIENKKTEFQFAKNDERGYIDNLNFNVNGSAVKLEYDAKHIDIAKIILNTPLKSGEILTITTPFHVKIPSSKFSRLGHSDQSYQITQWYPKPAVYDAKGWHAMPYLNQGEFYSEFGNYIVNITLPSNYVVAASGDLQTQNEIDFLNEKADETKRMSTDSKDLSFPASSSELKTIQYKLNNAHDFAWFADKRFHVLSGEVTLPYSQKKIKTYSYFTNLEANLWMKSIDYINKAVLNYSDWVGEYQWNVAQALEGSLSAGAGMEYPTITIIGESGTGQLLDEVITHEVGHNWFYGMLGFNERDFPWMDEGINSYYEHRYMEKYYPGETLNAVLGGFPLPEKISDEYSLSKATMVVNGALEKTNQSQSIALHSMEYTSFNYAIVVYMKTAYYMKYLADFLGQNTFDRVMGVFFNEWKMQHPYPEDMQKVFETETGEDLNWFFNGMLKEERSLDYKVGDIQVGKTSIVVRVTNNTNLVAPFPISQMNGDSIVKTDWQRGFTGTQTIYLNKNRDTEVTHVKIDAAGILPECEKENNTIKAKGLFKNIEPLQIKFLTSILDNPDKTNIFYSPVFGWNANDGFMLGLGIYNSIFAMPKFEYVFAPMYAFDSENISGQGSVGFNFYPENGFASRWRIASSFMNYTYYEKSVTDSAQVTGSEYFDFTKIENKIQVDLRKKSLRTSPQQTITFRNILINEEDAGVLSEINLFGDETFEMVNELKYDLVKKRILFPYSINGTLQLGDGYTRVTAEGNIRVNYPKSKNGIDIRLFAGKFFGESTGYYRNTFTMQGADGYEDFLYDEIFFGRNVYGGLWDNQIM
ncbi:MAG: M1 family metallopeptidase, partial [Fimbriimonadaceae bacterium]|nr:M1 family metallopeptidase [Chitinophagales bacterium]